MTEPTPLFPYGFWLGILAVVLVFYRTAPDAVSHTQFGLVSTGCILAEFMNYLIGSTE